ncbi:MAG: Non-canonical purine NTP pyrophosphatase [Candidatus Roizmanbacteria bacterium GW2011_GWC2_37_13]|uniref:Non-canonical purine NTP pyrophosphatase n=1 Tax=Candidatus Roizmanbacteria bacterium GW2011_GWC2_37_13 TaxID=1618486 RepID=A0A0G0IQW8_9BACT|nr:MAG: Non-canonical purine NTP pyrophosphatase [Candidatus Roizmanbacteria bacterium GW2011_GWC1_37_12]KKQ26579.1 MAG: Non-canonical purine NTP pyrophosphatase [Candidatus Roizmanbacteria bacterium GW2011_GWC2_37_13]
MKKLLLATHNPAKLEELKFGLKELENQGIKLLSLNDVRVEKEPEETGQTFQENSELKARFYSKLTSLPTIADDGGLIIPYLDNGPGVRSRRWPGYEATDQELIDYTLFHLRGVSGPKRTAYLETCVCFYMPGHPKRDQVIFEQEKVKGHIAEKPSWRPTNGYPFRALFIVDEFGKYYDELTDEEHDKINHRYRALKKLTKKIINLIRL